MGTFAVELSTFAAKAKENADLIVRKVALDILGRVIYRSPVGNPDLWKYPVKGYVGGQFRANWQLAVGSAPSDVLKEVDAAGRDTVAKGERALLAFTCGPSIFIVNNLPYGPRLENGYSKQAPAGFVKVTVAEYQQLIDRAVQEVR